MPATVTERKTKAGRKPLPDDKKRKLLAVRILPENLDLILRIKKKLPPSQDIVLNDRNGMASAGQVVDFLCHLAADLNVLSNGYVFTNTSEALSLIPSRKRTRKT